MMISSIDQPIHAQIHAHVPEHRQLGQIAAHQPPSPHYALSELEAHQLRRLVLVPFVGRAAACSHYLPVEQQ